MIDLSHVSKCYWAAGSPVHALRNAQLRVAAGGFVSIQGVSGSGKSTLMNVLGCLDTPDSGSYRLDGRSVNDLSPAGRARLRREKIGFIFQSFCLIPRLTALEQVELPLLYAGVPRRERRARAEAALNAVGLYPRRDHFPRQLSGGQQQRVAIARALVPGAPLLLADEPTGNLDPRTGRSVLDLLTTQWESGRTLVLITHDPSVANAAPRRLRLTDGALFPITT